jgi:hypothetical protein
MGIMSRADAQFMYINFYWIPRMQNSEANDLAQMASGYKAVTDRADLQYTYWTKEIGEPISSIT